ncbi:unnamed protein product, partial [Chrysoparadoxa australica]
MTCTSAPCLSLHVPALLAATSWQPTSQLAYSINLRVSPLPSQMERYVVKLHSRVVRWVTGKDI